MPFQIKTGIGGFRCDWCGKIVRENPIVVKTCCNNKPWTFCSRECYSQWTREWMRRQEQRTGQRKKQLL
ncbi:MAG: TRASH domain-containing protein [Candidatus Aramenus sp.]|nr:TRASH domain-containing protein [Candidatus Aramenus sp.]